jgi:hypothetical protein
MGAGGKRKGAGRKPCSDKKQTVCLYIETSIINALGGLERTKQILYNFAKIEAGGGENKNTCTKSYKCVVSQQSELIKAWLVWRLKHPYSDFSTQDYDIGKFLKAYND